MEWLHPLFQRGGNKKPPIRKPGNSLCKQLTTRRRRSTIRLCFFAFMWTIEHFQDCNMKVRRCQHTCWCWFSIFNSFYRSRVFHFLTRSLEIVLKFWAPKASFRRNSVIIDFLVNKLILSQTKYVVICFTLKPSQPENRSRIYFLAVAVRFWKCLIFGAINKTWIEFQVGLRIGSDFRSDRTLHRTRSDWRRIIIFGKSFF